MARQLGVDADALKRVLRALIGIGIFRKRRDGRYELNALADTLRTESPVSMAGMARWVGVAATPRALESSDRRHPDGKCGGARGAR